MGAIRLRIDGTTHDAAAGTTVLDAVRAAGIHLPALCHDDRLEPTGACRGCLVRVAGVPKAVPACTTMACEGMEIQTATDELLDARRTVLQMLARHYPQTALDRSPDHPFHAELRTAGLMQEAAGPSCAAKSADHSHPYIAVDMTRCIDCDRCVRICADLQGQFVWHVRGRGRETTVCCDGPTLLDSSCVSCGACVDTCPTGALEDRSLIGAPRPSTWTRTLCPYCGVGCELNVGTAAGRIVTIRPVRDSAVSKGHLCVKGRYAFDYVSAADRMTEPMIREGRSWRTITWNEARVYVADRLRALIEGSGPDSIGVLGSARATNEENYLAQKLARAVIGTNNVDCCARVCHAPSAAALTRAFGAGLATNSYDDLEQARTILVCGANVTESHPVLGARIKQAARRGAHLIVVDPRRIELADYADVHLAIRPGTNVALLNAMANVILAEHLVDADFLSQRVSGADEFAAWAKGWTPEQAAATCGVDADAIRLAARLYARGAPAMSVHGLGLTEHVHGTDGVTALINLALLTGNVGRPGAGVNPLRGQNNVQGAAHMGCDPHLLPGATAIAAGRERCESLWGVPLPRRPGLNVLEMMDAAIAGRLKGLWAIGYDVLLSNPNLAETRRALAALDFVVVQDMFLTQTAKEFGTVFLPACSSFEKDGTFMNAERRIQRVRAALRPTAHSKPDWQILCDIARAMGAHGFGFTAPEQIWNEVRDVCPGARGMTYARLDTAGLQWPCPTEEHPGTSILHEETFAIGPRAALATVPFEPTPEVITAEYPLRLITGRSLYQFNAGTMTGRTPNNALKPADVVSLSSSDADRLAIHPGATVRITSRYGSIELPAHVDAGLRPGDVFATFQQPSSLVNLVTSPHRDSLTSTPEYKVTAVRIEPTRITG